MLPQSQDWLTFWSCHPNHLSSTSSFVSSLAPPPCPYHEVQQWKGCC
jgi:hypothetical protein